MAYKVGDRFSRQVGVWGKEVFTITNITGDIITISVGMENPNMPTAHVTTIEADHTGFARMIEYYTKEA